MDAVIDEIPGVKLLPELVVFLAEDLLEGASRDCLSPSRASLMIASRFHQILLFGNGTPDMYAYFSGLTRAKDDGVKQDLLRIVISLLSPTAWVVEAPPG